jgi:hypothetical protein
MVLPDHREDVAAILTHRHDQGGDYWTTPDLRLGKGGSFSTLEVVRVLTELGVEPSDPVLGGAAELIWSTWREDGRFRLAPGSIYPCQTINAADALCWLGYASDPRLAVTFEHLLATRWADGGWRCAKFSYGRGPETECANPGPTLAALDAFRFRDGGATVETDAAADPGVPPEGEESVLDAAVDVLLGHWVTRAPLGPCHYGIGTLFLQVGYPFAGYNLFAWVHTLSFYPRARRDPRFREALAALESKLVDGQVVPERVPRAYAGYSFCRKGVPSALATRRYQEILANVARGPTDASETPGRAPATLA